MSQLIQVDSKKIKESLLQPATKIMPHFLFEINKKELKSRINDEKIGVEKKDSNTKSDEI